MSLTRRCINPVSPGWARYFDSDPPWSSPSRVAFGGPNLIWSNLSYWRQDNFAGSKIGRALASRARQGPRQGRCGQKNAPLTRRPKSGVPSLRCWFQQVLRGTARQLLLDCCSGNCSCVALTSCVLAGRPTRFYLLHPCSRALLYLPTPDRQGQWKCKRIVGNNPCPVGRLCLGRRDVQVRTSAAGSWMNRSGLGLL